MNYLQELGFYLQIDPLSADKWYICRNADNHQVYLQIHISASVAISADIICKLNICLYTNWSYFPKNTRK